MITDRKPISIMAHAIPIYDGHMIKSDEDLQEIVAGEGDLLVELINDFDIPFVHKKGYSYPRYKRTRRRKRAVGSDGEQEEEEDDDEEVDLGGGSDEDDDDDESEEKPENESE